MGSKDFHGKVSDPCEKKASFNHLIPNIKIKILLSRPYLSHSSSEENLIQYQENPSVVIMCLILMTPLAG